MKYVDNVSLSYEQVHNICRQYDTTGLEFISDDSRMRLLS